ncbi:MAG: hypothetical protein ACYTKD_32520 [Planctomycetota bacterium]|jgi:septal ring factor EnvC (AmiA/AmiB activator)
MAAIPSQKQTLEAMLLEIQTQTTEIQTQTAAIVAMQVDIAAQAADIAATAADAKKQKDFQRWQAEYLAGTNTELDDIEAGTHVF